MCTESHSRPCLAGHFDVSIIRYISITVQLIMSGSRIKVAEDYDTIGIWSPWRPSLCDQKIYSHQCVGAFSGCYFINDILYGCFWITIELLNPLFRKPINLAQLTRFHQIKWNTNKMLCFLKIIGQSFIKSN